MFKHRMFSAFAVALMTAQVAEGGEGAASVGTKIRPDLSNYVKAKSASGSVTKICGDEVSQALLGATLDEAYGFVSQVVGIPEIELRAKYGSRNLGQQRMFLGNLIRGGLVGKDAEKAARIKASFESAVPSFRGVIDTRLAADAKAVQDEKDAKAKAKTDAKAKADAKKAEDKAAKAAAKAEKPAKPAAPTAPKAPSAPAAPKQ